MQVEVLVQGKYSGIFKRASGQTDVVKVAGSGVESTSAAESLTDPLSVSVGYPKSIAVDSVGDVFIMTMFKAGNMTQGGLYVLSDTYTDYQSNRTHQRLTIANDKVNPFGGVINISNSKLTPGMINDTAGSIEFTAPNDATNEHKFANINVTAASVTDASEVGKMELGVACSDTGGIDSIITMTGGVDSQSSMTTIAGNLQFNGDVKLDSSVQTITVPYGGNPNMPLEHLELKTFDTPLDFGPRNYDTRSSLDSDGNIIFTGGNSGKIYKSTPTGEITVLTTYSTQYGIESFALDKTDNSMYLDRNDNFKITKIIKQGTIVDYNITASGGEYLINGYAKPAMKLYVGVTYRFIISDSVSANHPFFLTTSSTGGGSASSNSIHSGSEVTVTTEGDTICKFHLHPRKNVIFTINVVIIQIWVIN